MASNNTNNTIKRALISVSDKTNLIPFAQTLCTYHIELLSTGGTANTLKENNIPVTDVSDYTRFPEIMRGRIKTLHPKIHGALLSRTGVDDDIISDHEITPIDLVVVNLYPFSATINNPENNLEDAIENIDIGGPTMLRASAKNHERVTTICDINDYGLVLEELEKKNGETTKKTRFMLAQKVFDHTSQYDRLIANYFLSQNKNLAQIGDRNYKKSLELRYGENPHQKAMFYIDDNTTTNSISNAKQLQGKALSYNNIADADAALECVRNFSDLNACVIVKHANPCSVAVAESQKNAYELAFGTYPTSAFGGIIAFNQTLIAETAQQILDNQFVEVVIAPTIDKSVAKLFEQKPNVRLLECGDISSPTTQGFDYKKVNGGLLVQELDTILYDEKNLNIVTTQQPTYTQMQDLTFASTVAKYVKSNAIVYAKNNATIGIGAGQMSRVDSTKIAALKAQDANLEIAGSVMASDAFFPFRDAIDAAAKAGITAIIQPGGSIRDNEIIEAAYEHNIAMVFTGIRHFRH